MLCVSHDRTVWWTCLNRGGIVVKQTTYFRIASSCDFITAMADVRENTAQMTIFQRIYVHKFESQQMK
jgi:hypothetical protein